MSQKIIRNPSELPTTKTSTTNHNPMATSSLTTGKALDEFQEQAKTALYILGGQAVSAQANAIIVPSLLQNQSATTKQVAKAGIPLALGVVLALTVKSKIVRGLSLGFGTQGVLEAIKLVMPDFAPAEGFGDPSHYVYTDQNGKAQQVAVNENGQLVQLPAANESHHQSSGGSSQLGEWAGSNYAEDVEYV